MYIKTSFAEKINPFHSPKKSLEYISKNQFPLIPLFFPYLPCPKPHLILVRQMESRLLVKHLIPISVSVNANISKSFVLSLKTKTKHIALFYYNLDCYNMLPFPIKKSFPHKI